MGSVLYDCEPVFRAAVDACSETAHELGMEDEFGFSLVEAFQGAATSEGQDVRAARWLELVCLGVIQIALCDLWSSVGVKPDATLSISLGDMVAPYASGALSRKDVVAVLYAANRVCTQQTCDGMLLQLAADPRTARDLCGTAPARLDFLGATGPTRSLVFTSLQDAEENDVYLQGNSVVIQRYASTFAYHSSRSAFDLSSLERDLSDLSPQPPGIPMFSAIAGGDIAADASFDAMYWHWMVRRPFWYGDAVVAALQGEPAVVVNIGADPSTALWIRDTADQLGLDPPIFDSIRSDGELETWAQTRAVLARLGSLRGRRPSPAPPSTAGAPDPVTLDLAGPEVVRDPFTSLALLRSVGAVHHLPRHDAWLVVGYEEVRAALERPDLFSSRLLGGLDPLVLGADPPDHTTARRALALRFGPAALADLGFLITEASHATLERLVGADEFDVVADFARPLGELVAARLIGLDDDQLARIRTAIGDPERDSDELVARVDRAFSQVLADPQPVDRLLWVAATTTTKRLIVTAVLLLIRDLNLRSHIREDHGLLPALVDEVARLHPPELMLSRVTIAEAALGGVAIPAGSVVRLSLAAANRDPKHFPEPDRLVLGRTTGHLAFGSGPHRCLGTGLARMQARSALSALLERMPGFRGTQPEGALRWIRSTTTHGVEQLVISPNVYASTGRSLLRDKSEESALTQKAVVSSADPQRIRSRNPPP